MRHPLHPALVHFPVACWSLATFADFASLRSGSGNSLWHWSAGLLSVGCLTALAAMLAGLFEFPRVPNGVALRDTFLHLSLMLVAFALYAFRLGLRMYHLRPLPPDALSLSLDAAAFVALLVGGWLGGRLVFGYGIGR
ncbi:MAG TPA: DUF2231 domain-containing protein [Castellaniella sp.]|uniref:DUF2231 domain-containing protein n=1 Tax=Castellaniella sp. TaxID=1955812 RepID=UPI002F1DC2D0